MPTAFHCNISKLCRKLRGLFLNCGPSSGGERGREGRGGGQQDQERIHQSSDNGSFIRNLFRFIVNWGLLALKLFNMPQLFLVLVMSSSENQALPIATISKDCLIFMPILHQLCHFATSALSSFFIFSRTKKIRGFL